MINILIDKYKYSSTKYSRNDNIKIIFADGSVLVVVVALRYCFFFSVWL